MRSAVDLEKTATHGMLGTWSRKSSRSIASRTPPFARIHWQSSPYQRAPSLTTHRRDW